MKIRGLNARRASYAAACAIVMQATAVQAQAPAQTFSFGISSRELGAALRAFAHASRQQVTFSDRDVRGKRSQALNGTYTVHDALDIMLAGSGLTAERGRSGLLIVRPLRLATTQPMSRMTLPAAPATPLPAPPPRDMASGTAESEADIVVTARKRDETSLSVPIVVSAISREQLQLRGINTLEGFGRTVPTLMLGESGGATQGGIVALRGISGGGASPFGDQAVSFNIDGVQVARSSVRRMSEMDLAQIEVLKGPQALYFGKNSPAGIVVINTADPGDHLEAGGNLGYEFHSREVRGEGYLSTPLTESLGIRLAGSFSRKRGDFENVATPSATLGPVDRHPAAAREYAGRVTLKFDDGGPFDARLKFTMSKLTNNGPGGSAQRLDCPYGVAHAFTVADADGNRVAAGLGGPDDCRVDGKTVRADAAESFNALWPLVRDGTPFGRQTQMIGGLTLNYHLGDALTLTSQTGYYRTRYRSLENFAYGDTSFPAQNFVSDVYLNMREVSQDLHLTTDLPGPINFLLGGFYQNQKLFNAQISVLNADNPLYAFVPNSSTMTVDAYSVYGSVTIKPTETIEISGGGRYSHEDKKYAAFRLCPLGATVTSCGPGAVDTTLAGTTFDPSLPGGTAVPRRKFNDFSPEATIAWRPSNRLTVFGSYKRGFLSGGYQTGSGDLSVDQSYDQQIVKGFEGGVKGLALNNALRFGASLFTYKITGQQVANVIGSAQFIRNAAASRVKGVEADLNWTTPVRGLALRGGGAYTHGRYLSYRSAPCYAGQTVALGCTLADGSASQDLSGQQLLRSPDWGFFAGGTLEHELGDGARIGITSDANYTSGYYTDGTNKPASRQGGYWLLDATAFFKRGPLELSLIGRNLTDKRYYQASFDAIFSGATNATRTQGILADTVGSVSRGREIMVRVAYAFGR